MTASIGFLNKILNEGKEGLTRQKVFGKDRSKDVGRLSYNKLVDGMLFDSLKKIGVEEIIEIGADRGGDVVESTAIILGYKVASNDPQQVFVYKGKATPAQVIKVIEELENQIED